jgi:hypothetical protein
LRRQHLQDLAHHHGLMPRPGWCDAHRVDHIVGHAAAYSSITRSAISSKLCREVS